MTKAHKKQAKKHAKKHVAKKKSTVKAKGSSLASIKASLSKIDQTYAASFAVAKKEAQKHAASAMKLIAHYNQELKKLAGQDKTLQQKLQKAESQLKAKASSANKAAVKKAKKMWDDFKKQQQEIMQEFKQTETVHYLAKSAATKSEFLAHKLNEIAKAWKPPVHKPIAIKLPTPKKAVKRAPKAEKKVASPVAKKPTFTLNKPAASPVVPKAAPMMPPRAPLGLSGQNQAPIRPPFTSITPQNIARQPLTGSVRPGHDMGNKSFSFKDDF